MRLLIRHRKGPFHAFVYGCVAALLYNHVRGFVYCDFPTGFPALQWAKNGFTPPFSGRGWAKKIRPLLLKYQDKDGGPVARRF